MSRIGKSIETESRFFASWREGEQCGVIVNDGYRVSFQGDKNILELDSGDGCTTL